MLARSSRSGSATVDAIETPRSEQIIKRSP